MLALSDGALRQIAPHVALSDVALKQRRICGDDKKQVLYVARHRALTVVRFDHPISRDAELLALAVCATRCIVYGSLAGFKAKIHFCLAVSVVGATVVGASS